MKILPLLALLLLTASPLAATPAANPVAAAVAAPDRPADQVELDAGRKPVEVLTFFGLKPGDRVLDVMAGGGYYTEIMARAVGPTGYVMALEPPQFVKTDKAKARKPRKNGRNAKLCDYITPTYEHEIIPGETVSEIAGRYGVLDKDIKRWNKNLKNINQIRDGQTFEEAGEGRSL